jgi:hypothetical protein
VQSVEEIVYFAMGYGIKGLGKFNSRKAKKMYPTLILTLVEESSI